MNTAVYYFLEMVRGHSVGHIPVIILRTISVYLLQLPLQRAFSLLR